MEFETGQELQNRVAAQSGLLPDVTRDMPQSVSGFLVWLMLWLRLCLEQSCHQAGHTPVRSYEPNRYRRRLDGRVIAPIRNNRPYYVFFRRELSPTQFMERLVSISGRGRVSVYGMRYWRKTIKGKAAPLGTEHEYWRDPLGRIGKRIGKLLCGVWAAHL